MPTPALRYDAIVLSGGRGARLGGVSKGQLTIGGCSLLSLALDAAAKAENVVVVGPTDKGSTVSAVREDPPFAGPAAAIGAGLASLHTEGAGWVLVLACDLPAIAGAVDALLAALPSPIPAHWDAVVGVDSSGTPQPLLGLYRRGSLAVAFASRIVTNLSIRALIADLHVSTVKIADSLLADIDTPADAANRGVVVPASVSQQEAS